MEKSLPPTAQRILEELSKSDNPEALLNSWMNMKAQELAKDTMSLESWSERQKEITPENRAIIRCASDVLFTMACNNWHPDPEIQRVRDIESDVLWQAGEEILSLDSLSYTTWKDLSKCLRQKEKARSALKELVASVESLVKHVEQVKEEDFTRTFVISKEDATALFGALGVGVEVLNNDT